MREELQPDQPCQAVHLSSQALTSRIAKHRFRLESPASIFWRPTEHITIKLPPDFDPTTRYDAESELVLTFTPCGPIRTLNGDTSVGSNLRGVDGDIISDDDHDTEQETKLNSSTNNDLDFEILTSRGRIVSLIGLPRFKPLRINILTYGGGFPADLLSASHETIMVAGGTGIAPFLSLPLDLRSQKSLVWCINSLDYKLVRAVNLYSFRTARIFLSPVQDSNAGAINVEVGPNTCNRRLEQQDFEQICTLSDSKTILFCGGKAFEWQIKWWALSLNKSIITVPRPEGF